MFVVLRIIIVILDAVRSKQEFPSPAYFEKQFDMYGVNEKATEEVDTIQKSVCKILKLISYSVNTYLLLFSCSAAVSMDLNLSNLQMVATHLVVVQHRRSFVTHLTSSNAQLKLKMHLLLPPQRFILLASTLYLP